MRTGTRADMVCLCVRTQGQQAAGLDGSACVGTMRACMCVRACVLVCLCVHLCVWLCVRDVAAVGSGPKQRKHTTLPFSLPGCRGVYACLPCLRCRHLHAVCSVFGRVEEAQLAPLVAMRALYLSTFISELLFVVASALGGMQAAVKAAEPPAPVDPLLDPATTLPDPFAQVSPLPLPLLLLLRAVSRCVVSAPPHTVREVVRGGAGCGVCAPLRHAHLPRHLHT